LSKITSQTVNDWSLFTWVKISI